MSIQSFSQPKIKFLDPVRFDSPYRLPILGVTMLSGLWAGKQIARYIRDHNFNQFAHANRSVIRNAYRLYSYLFPIGSDRRYFMEVALPDNLVIALLAEVHLHTMPYPIERPGSNIEEVILTVGRIFFFIYSMNKARQGIYKTLRSIPHHITWVCALALALAPTSIYSIEEAFEFRN